MLLSDLLSKGFLPKELPPPFQSKDLQFFGSGVLPSSWQVNNKGEFHRPCELERYNHRRVGYLRRRLAFPNPIMYYHLAATVSSSWLALRKHLSQGSWSVTRPTRRNTRGRAFSAIRTHDSYNATLAKVRETSRYSLTADIGRFYPSIYTHAVPWALHGKSVAKTDFKPMATLGNRLDYWLRMGQSKQTVGLPIGPDTSWLISELVLVAVEKAFKQRYGASIRGCSLIDDYEFGFASQPAAEEALAVLEASLNEFELSLNPKKTLVRPLPQLIGSAWPESISTYEFRKTSKAQATDLIRFFNIVFEHALAYPEDHVIKYAISRLSTFHVAAQNWPLYQSLLIHCMTIEPSCLPAAESELRRQRARGRSIDQNALSECLEALVVVGAPLGHSAEVSWALWLAIIFGATLGKAAADAVSSMLDSCAALTALHAESLGVFSAPLDHTLWSSTQQSDELWGRNWLLAYEANAHRWLPSGAPKDHVRADAAFRELKIRGVKFYDAQTLPAPSGTGRVRVTPGGYQG